VALIVFAAGDTKGAVVILIILLQDIFRTQALTLSELLLCIRLSSIVFWAVEIEKWFKINKV